jgi:hypothetical protein
MLRRGLIAVIAILIASSAFGKSHIRTVGQMMSAVRERTGIGNTTMLPDSTLLHDVDLALNWTSIDCGGIEDSMQIISVAGQAWYAVPDTVVEILYGTIVSNGFTKQIKAWYPQYSEDESVIGKGKTIDNLGNTTGPDATPPFFNYWGGVMQFLPVPIQVDTFYFKDYVEHPTVDSTADSVLLKTGYIEAALDYACHLVYQDVKEYDQASVFEKQYGEKRDRLQAKYTRRFDILTSQAK